MSNFETVIYEKKDGVASVTLNRPHVLNVCNTQMRNELCEVLDAIADDSDVAVVIFKGAGEKAFCAGADLHDFLKAPSPVVARQARWQRDLWRKLLTIQSPLIAALHGYVLGFGVELALCCDIRIAAEDSQFGLPEVSLGIIPAGGGTQNLPRTVGLATALKMTLAGSRLGAAEALNVGLVNQVVPKNRLELAATRVAEKVNSFDALAVRYAKQAVVRGLDLPLHAGLALEARLSGALLRRAIRSG